MFQKKRSHICVVCVAKISRSHSYLLFPNAFWMLGIWRLCPLVMASGGGSHEGPASPLCSKMGTCSCHRKCWIYVLFHTPLSSVWDAAEMEWELAVFCFHKSKLPKNNQTNHFCTENFNKNMCFFNTAESGVYIFTKKPCPTSRLGWTEPWFHHILCIAPQTFPVRGQQYLKLIFWLIIGRWMRLFNHGYTWEPFLLFSAHRLRHHPKLPDNYCHAVWWVGESTVGLLRHI